MNLAEVLAQQGYAGNDPFPSNVRQPQPDELATALADIGVGIPANLAGLPVDLASALIRPFGYNVPPEQTVGSTEWFQSRAGRDPNSAASMLSAYVSPDPLDALKLGGDVGLAMTLAHGSPHKFDRFSLDKIGTGEGAQAYGWGGYLSESTDVGRGYQAMHIRPEVLREEFEKATGGRVHWAVAQDAANRFLNNKGNARETIEYIRKRADDFASEGDSQSEQIYRSALKSLEESQKDLEKIVPNYGYLYSVDVPDNAIEGMLEWHTPLKDQSAKTKGALLQVKSDHPDAWAAAENEGWGNSLYTELSYKLGSDKAASEYLNSVGIPGITYVGEYGKTGGKGARNFVVFDENLITPLTRNGEPIK